jgi:hypothetical protein
MVGWDLVWMGVQPLQRKTGVTLRVEGVSRQTLRMGTMGDLRDLVNPYYWVGGVGAVTAATTSNTTNTATLISYQEVLDLYHSIVGEKKMTIGGEQCHLCGAARKEESYTNYYKKKRTLTKSYVLYRCGTEVSCSCGEKKVIVGGACI